MVGRLHDMRAELRALRKDSVKPVSRMRLGDVSAEIERLRGLREETPAAAATPSAPHKAQEPAAMSIKHAKEMDFPVRPAASAAPKRPVGRPAAVKKGKDVVATAVETSKTLAQKRKDKLAKLLDAMDDDE